MRQAKVGSALIHTRFQLGDCAVAIDSSPTVSTVSFREDWETVKTVLRVPWVLGHPVETGCE